MICTGQQAYHTKGFHPVRRVGDSDARCGPASIQRFDGEDLSIASRVLGQNEQCRAWWEAELAKKQADKEAEELHKQSIASRVSQSSIDVFIRPLGMLSSSMQACRVQSARLLILN